MESMRNDIPDDWEMSSFIEQNSTHEDVILKNEESEIFNQSRISTVELLEAHGIDVNFSDTKTEIVFKIGDESQPVRARVCHDPSRSMLYAMFSHGEPTIVAYIPLYAQHQEVLEVRVATSPVWEHDKWASIDAPEEKTYIQGVLEQLCKESQKGIVMGEEAEQYSSTWLISYSILPYVSELQYRSETFAEYIKRHTESIL